MKMFANKINAIPLLLLFSATLIISCGVSPARIPPIVSFSPTDEHLWWTSSEYKLHSVSRKDGSTTNHLAERKVQRVYFVDSKTGWVQTLDGELLSTSNGGETWEGLLNIGVGKLGGFEFTDTKNGWMLGGFFLNNTSDGGRSWQSIHISGSALLEDTLMQPFTFSSAPNGSVCIGTSDGHVVNVAENRQITLAKLPDSEADIIAVNALDADRCFAGAGGGVGQGLYYTRNGGKEWTRIEASQIYNRMGITAITFSSLEIGWLTGQTFVTDPDDPNKDRGFIFKSVDGGQTWTRVQSQISAKVFTNVIFLDRSNGWLIGDSEVWETKNGGDSWDLVLKTAD